jgi:hypothetical protein
MAPTHIAAISANALNQKEFDHGAWKNEGAELVSGGFGVSSVSHDELV